MRSTRALLHEPSEVARFLDEVRRMLEVLACDKVNVEFDGVLKVLVCIHRDFNRFWSVMLIHIPAVARNHAGLVTHDVKTRGASPCV